MTTYTKGQQITLLLISYFVAVIGLAANNVPVAETEHLEIDKVDRENVFRENKGQWPEHILYRANFGSQQIYAEKGNLTWVQQHPEDLKKRASCKFDPKCSFWEHPIRSFAFKLHFEGSNPNFINDAYGPSKEYFNYFRGNDPSKWATDIHEYQKIAYRNIYDGVDYVLYMDGGFLKYDFVIEAGADPSQIKLVYEGLNGIDRQDENLYLRTGIDDIFEHQPYTYQIIGGKEVYVESRFEIEDNTVSFSFPNGYDSNYPLIIDPVLVFSSYSGSVADNWGKTATPGPNGELFGGGTVFEPGYPTTIGAFQTSFNSTNTNFTRFVDMGITKFSADGSSRIYSTYLGGDKTDMPHSLIVNSRNELVIMGSSSSTDFPITFGAYQSNYAGGNSLPLGSTNQIQVDGSDIVIAVLNAQGNALVGSTFIGGQGNDGINGVDNDLANNYGDQFRGEVIVDDQDNIYVASVTESSDFPITSNAFQSSYGGGRLDGVVFSLNRTCSNLRFSTFVGGSSADAAYSIKIDNNGDLFVAGGTKSGNLPTTAGVINPNFMGGTVDGFVSKLNNDASGLLASTFIGTNSFDQVYFLDTDNQDRIYIYGQTRGRMQPTEGVYSNPNSSQFIKRLNNDLGEEEITTVFGSSRGDIDISPTALLVDDCNRIYVSGWGGDVNQGFSPSSSTNGLPVTFDAFQQDTDGSDFYFFVLEEDASQLIYATFFGGIAGPFGNFGEEHVDGGTSRFSKEGTIYQAVCASCGGVDIFPTTEGVVAPNNLSPNCNLGVVKFDFELDEIIARGSVGVGTTGCAPFTANFRNASSGTRTFLWDFGDGNTSEERAPIHQYEEEGVYEAMLIALSPNSCLEPDTAILTIEVLAPTESLKDTFEICDNTPITLSSQIMDPGAEFLWNTGEISPSISALQSDLYIVESRFENCIYRDSFTVINSTPTLTISDSIACDASFLELNLDSRAENIVWNTGDSDLEIVVTEPGLYFVDYNIGNCAFSDSALITFPISPEILLTGDSLSCEGDVVTLSVVETKGVPIQNYNWSTGETGNSIEVEENGVYSVTGLSEGGCEDFESINVFFIPELPAVPEFSDTLICADGSLTADLSEYEEFAEIKWSDGSEEFIRILEEAGSFNFEIENICDKLSGRLVLEKSPYDFGELPMYFPNVFSPNNDGINDLFKPEFPPELEIIDYHLQVFDRWGNKVFESFDPENGWNGIYQEDKMDPAVFAWIADVKFFLCEEPVSKMLEGDITILR